MQGQSDDWRMRSDFEALTPLLDGLNFEQALELRDTVGRECRLMAAAISHPDLLATDIQNADKAELCELHCYFEALAEFTGAQSDFVSRLLVPWARKFAGMVQSEAMKRGVNLISVDHPPEARLAMAVALTLAFDPDNEES